MGCVFIVQSKILTLVSGLIFFISSVACADIVPLRQLDQLNAPISELGIKVPTAKVLIADYKLIRRDFPEFKEAKEGQIDEWLLSKTAYIAKTQWKQTQVNTKIPVEGFDTARFHRPKNYGRAGVFEVSKGLIDAKGIGSLKPRQGSHSNGLMTVAEGIKEFAYERMVQGILDHHKKYVPSADFKTVGTYAVIDWGFDVIHPNLEKSPAGFVLRQAHDRYESLDEENYNFLPPKVALEIEKILRLYGVTSAGATQIHGYEVPMDMVNLQGTKEGALVDFGSFYTGGSFEKVLVLLVDPETELLPDSKEFVQPHSKIRLPLKKWGYIGKADADHDLVLLSAARLARALRSGNQQRHDLETYIFKELMGEAKARWEKYDREVLATVRKSLSPEPIPDSKRDDTVSKNERSRPVSPAPQMNH